MRVDSLLDELAEEWGTGVREFADGLGVRAAVVAGTTTIVDVRRAPGMHFTPVWRLRIHTFVAEGVAPDAPGLVGLIGFQNRLAAAGAWEWHADGVIGLTCSMLLHGDTMNFGALVLRPLIAEHLAEVKRCLPTFDEWLSGVVEPEAAGWAGGFGADAGTPVDVNAMTTMLQLWTSVPMYANREWIVEDAADDHLTIRAADLVGSSVAGPNRVLQLDRLVHPVVGWGWRLLADLHESIGDDYGLLIGSGLQSDARGAGAIMGAVLMDPDRPGQAVAHAFVSDQLLLDVGSAATELLVRAMVGVVHCATFADAAIRDFRGDGESADVARLLENGRQSAVRAAAGPAALDIGPALLDFLALSRLKIGTAPFSTSERGFRWRPTSCVQSFEADAALELEGHVIVRAQVRTELGMVSPDAITETMAAISHDNTFLPAMGLVLEPDGTVALLSTWVTHEGTHVARQNHIAVVAALQATFTPVLLDIIDDITPIVDAELDERGDGGDDPITAVGPDLMNASDFVASLPVTALRRFAAKWDLHYEEADDGAAHVVDLLIDRGPGESLFGLVSIDRSNDKFYGAGYAIHGALVGDHPELSDGLLNDLTRVAHAGIMSSIVPSWCRSPDRGAGPHLTVPALLLAAEPLNVQSIRLTEACRAVLSELRAFAVQLHRESDSA